MADLPDWYVPETPAAAPQGTAPAQVALPDWYTPEPGAPAAPAVQPAPQPAVKDPVAQNATTGALHAWGALIGAPREISHLTHGLVAKGLNLVDGGNRTADTIDAALGTNSPWVSGPSAQDVNHVVDQVADAGSKAVGGPGFQAYQPVTPQGQIGQAAVTGGISGLLDPAADINVASRLWSTLKGGAAGGAAELTHQWFPKSDLAPALAAFLTHAGLSTGATLGNVANQRAIQPIVDPQGATDYVLAKGLKNISPTTEPLATPSTGDIAAHAGQLTGTTPTTPAPPAFDISPERVAQSEDVIKSAIDPLYDRVRQERIVTPPEMTAAGLDTPAIGDAMNSAAATVRNTPGQSPTAAYLSLLGPNGLRLHNDGITPDWLLTTKSQLGADAATARKGMTPGSGNTAAAGINASSSGLDDFMRNTYPNSYPLANDTASALYKMRDQQALSGPILDGASTNWGGIRNNDGVVTASSLDTWMRKNADTVSDLYGGNKNVPMRLAQVREALKTMGPPTNIVNLLGRAVTGLTGKVIGGAIGDSEGAVEALIMGEGHSMSARTTQLNDMFSRGIEQVLTDPNKLNELGALLARKPAYLQGGDVLARYLLTNGLMSVPRGAVSATPAQAMPPLGR